MVTAISGAFGVSRWADVQEKSLDVTGKPVDPLTNLFGLGAGITGLLPLLMVFLMNRRDSSSGGGGDVTVINVEDDD